MAAPQICRLLREMQVTQRHLTWRTKSSNKLRPCRSRKGGDTRQVSPGQISVSVLQLYILITVPQLTLHISVAGLILLVLLHRALTSILIFRFVHGCFLLLHYGPQLGWRSGSRALLHSEGLSRESAVRECLSHSLWSRELQSRQLQER